MTFLFVSVVKIYLEDLPWIFKEGYTGNLINVLSLQGYFKVFTMSDDVSPVSGVVIH